MCTLAGFCKLPGIALSKEDVERLLQKVDIRGRDAFACVYRTYGSSGFSRIVSESKSTVINHIVETVGWDDIEMLFSVGRAVPAAERVSGDVCLTRDSQPFFSASTVVSHNGLIANDESLVAEYGITRTSSVDTSILPGLIDKIGFYRTAQEIKGSFALAAYTASEDSIWLATNFMPLVVKEEHGVVWWASDESMLNGGTQLPYYSMLKIPLSTMKPKKKEMANALHQDEVLVVCSGGLDSTTTASLYKALGYKVRLLHFKYGQAAEEAEDYATSLIARELGVEKYLIIATEILQQISSASPLLGMKERGERHWDMESTYSYVGARNLIFASMAMSLAEKLGIGNIALGLNLDDSTYPDNNITFVKELDKIGALSLNWNNRVRMKAPLVNLTKKEIIEVGIAVNTPFHLQVSCYYPSVEDGHIVNCGTCGCDKLREYSFRALKRIDPIRYREQPSWDGCSPLEIGKQQFGEIPYDNYLLI